MPFIPQEKEVSWTDYNSVEQLYSFFHCHPMAAIIHNGDTLKVSGYLSVLPGTDSNYYTMPQWSIALVEDTTKYLPVVYLDNPDGIEIPGSFWPKRLYVKGSVCYNKEAETEPDCCSAAVETIKIIQIDTIVED